jgi:hypothetical protein
MLLIAVLALGMAQSGVAHAQSESWHFNPANGHYYRLTEELNWFDAEDQAVIWGGHLVTLDDAEEELWVKDTFSRFEHFWIGFNDIEEEGNWIWSSGAPVTYTNWDQGEPNNCCDCSEYPGCEDAAVMNWQADTGSGSFGDYWNDLAPDAMTRGVVERGHVNVSIDIKPGGDPNSINCQNEKGVITVALLTTNDFNALTVDHTTVIFEGASETHRDKRSGEPRRHEDDVDKDGDTDLVFHFRLGDTDLTCESTEGMLMGETVDGILVKGTDAVRMVNPGCQGYGCRARG